MPPPFASGTSPVRCVVTAAGGGGGGAQGAGGTASGATGGNGAGGLGDGIGATPSTGGARGGTLGHGGFGEPMVGGGAGGGGLYGGGGSGQYVWCDLCTEPLTSPGGGGGAGSSGAPTGSTIVAGPAGNGSLTLTWVVTGPVSVVTTTTATASPNSVEVGGTSTVTASVSSAAGPVLGSVVFQLPGGPTTVPLLPDGSANALFVANVPGGYPVHIEYLPADGYVGSSAVITVNVVDTAAPTVTTSFPSPPAGGWFNGEVTGSVSATDVHAVSSLDCVGASVSNVQGLGTAHATAVLTVTGEGSNAVSCTAKDPSGNTGSSAPTTVPIDRTAPTVTTSFPVSPASGCFTAPVTGSLWATDSGAIASLACVGAVASNLQGIGSTSASAALSVTGEGTHAVSCTATDAAGNSSSSPSTTLELDTVAPTLSWTGGPSGGGTYVFGSVPNAPTCTASDSGSGPAGCAVTGYDSMVGTHVLTAKATDVAGNVTTETRTYTVAAWELRGFYSPVDMGNVVNTVKAGNTVPLKFEVFAGGVEQTSTSVIRSVRAQASACSAGAPQDEIEVTSTGETAMRYDATDGAFIYNWKTPKLPGSCLDVIVQTLDGSTIVAHFRLR